MNIAAMEADLRTKAAAATALLTAQMTTAQAENRERTAEEIAAVQVKYDEANALKARIETARAEARQAAGLAALTAGMTEGGSNEPGPRARLTLGAQLAAHPDYQHFIRTQQHRRSGSWTSQAWELPHPLRGATLTEDAASGGTLVQPQLLPGIQELMYRRLTVRDLLSPGSTDSNAILYLKEKVFTNAAAAVAEGAVKPESTLTFENATSTVKKLAHWLPVTEEMLEDFSGIRSFVDARLRLGLSLTEEDELLNGSGLAEHLLGLRTNVGLAADVVRGADTNIDAILKQITAIATGALIQPDGIVMNPTNWQTIQLIKNAAGNYMGTGPWAGPQSPTLWGLPVAVTPAMAATVALVGAFKMAAQIFDRGGVRVEVSNSHSDFFVRNLVAIRCEERLALAVYRPAAIGEVTGLN